MTRVQILAKIAELRVLIAITHANGVRTSAQIKKEKNPKKLAALKKHEAALEALNRYRRNELNNLLHPPKPTPPKPAKWPITMYDAVDVNQIPSNPSAVAGYVGGYWPTYHSLLSRFPHSRHLSIAINAYENAECLDIETGDAVPSQAPSWVRRQHARGVRRPVVYASSSVMPTVTAYLHQNGITRNQYRIWTAHYTGVAHIEPGSDATQWTSNAHGRNLDASLCAPNFFS